METKVHQRVSQMRKTKNWIKKLPLLLQEFLKIRKKLSRMNLFLNLTIEEVIKKKVEQILAYRILENQKTNQDLNQLKIRNQFLQKLELIRDNKYMRLSLKNILPTRNQKMYKRRKNWLVKKKVLTFIPRDQPHHQSTKGDSKVLLIQFNLSYRENITKKIYLTQIMMRK